MIAVETVTAAASDLSIFGDTSLEPEDGGMWVQNIREGHGSLSRLIYFCELANRAN